MDENAAIDWGEIDRKVAEATKSVDWAEIDARVDAALGKSKTAARPSPSVSGHVVMPDYGNVDTAGLSYAPTSVPRALPAPRQEPSLTNAPEPGLLEDIKDALFPTMRGDFEPDTESKIRAQERLAYDVAIPGMVGITTPMGAAGAAGAAASMLGGHALRDEARGDPLLHDTGFGDVLRAASYGRMRGPTDIFGNAAKMYLGDLGANTYETGDWEKAFEKTSATDPLIGATAIGLAAKVPSLASSGLSALGKGPIRAMDDASRLTRVDVDEAPIRALRSIDPMEALSNRGGAADVTVTGVIPQNLPEPGPAMRKAQAFGSTLTTPIRRLEMSPDPLRRQAGAMLAARNNYRRELLSTGKLLAHDILSPLSEAERLQVGPMILEGPVDKLGRVVGDSPVAQAARRLQTEIFEPFDDLQQIYVQRTRNNVTGEVAPYRSVRERYFPRVLKDLPEDVNQLRWQIERELTTPELAGAQEVGASLRRGEQLTRRTLKLEPQLREWDAAKVIDSYIDKAGTRVSDAATLGPPGELGMPSDAARILGEMRARGDHFGADTFSGALDVALVKDMGPEKKAIDTAKRAVSNMLLFKSAITQTPQIASNVMDAGVGNTAKGLWRYMRSPAFREMSEASGARDPGIMHFFAEVGGAEPSTLPMQAMGAMERHINRGSTAAGLAFRAEDTARQAYEDLIRQVPDDVMTAGLERSRFETPVSVAIGHGAQARPVIQKLASEMRETPEQLAAYYHAGRQPIGRELAALTERRQFQTDAGEVPNFFRRTPAGGLIGQYRPYAVRQGNMVLDDIIKPMVDADPELRQLGRERLVRYLAAGVPLALASKMTKAAMTLSPVSGGLLVGSVLGALGGLHGDIISSGLAGSRSNRGSFFDSPGMSVGGDIAGNLINLASGPDRGKAFGQLALRYGAPAVSPTIGGALGPPAYNYLFNRKKKRH